MRRFDSLPRPNVAGRVMKLAFMLTMVTAAAACAPASFLPNQKPWADLEDDSYRKWEHKTGRDHAEYDSRPSKEQQEYWRWRADNA